MESIVKMGFSGASDRDHMEEYLAEAERASAQMQDRLRRQQAKWQQGESAARNRQAARGASDMRRAGAYSPEVRGKDVRVRASQAALPESAAGRQAGAGTAPAAERARAAEKVRAAGSDGGRAAAANEERAQMAQKRRQYRLVAEYVVVTVVACYILLRATDNLGAILSALGRGARVVALLLTPLLWGFILAYILSPLVGLCEKKMRRMAFFRKPKKRVRSAAVAATCVATLLAVAILLSIVVSAITKSLRVASLEDLVALAQSFAGTLGNFQQTILARLGEMNVSSAEITSALRQIGEQVASFTGGLSTGLAGAIGHVGSFLTNLVFAIIFAIYFLLDGKGLMRYWNRVLLALGGRAARRNFHILARDADAVFSGYIRGQLMDALIMAFLVSGALSLVGVQYAVIIGVLSGLGNLIPYLGPVVAYGSTILVCLVAGDLRRLLVALVILFVIQTVDGNIINPRLLSTSIDVHPMLVIAALIIGGSFGGIAGMLFAVPVAAFLKIQFDKCIAALLDARDPERTRRASRHGKRRKSQWTCRENRQKGMRKQAKRHEKTENRKQETGNRKQKTGNRE